MTLYVDVSHHDRDRRGSPLEWELIAQDTGQGTVMVARASYGDPEGYSPETRFFAEHQTGARDAGYTCRGGYHNLIHGDAASIARQVDYLRRELDATGCVWGMCDVEPYATLRENGLWPRWDDALRFRDRWQAVETRVMAWYIARWVWSGWLNQPDLTQLPGPLVNAHYPPANPPDTPGRMYQTAGGDDGPGWQSYGGRNPDMWQLTSVCSLEGASVRTDLDAYRGTVTELVSLLGGDVALPIRTVVMPTSLRGQSNGKLDPTLLLGTPGQAGGPSVRLVSQAARAWRAMCAAALSAGHTLKATSLYDSYRPYEIQERLFRERFTLTPTSTGVTRTWQGQTWYLRPGVALAAVPGTSNHGWGIAVDTGEERDGDAGTESLDSGTLSWLVGNAHRFGFSWELQSEPWHIRYVSGDAIPAAVLAYEEDDMDAAGFLALLRDPRVAAEMSRLPWAFKPADHAGLTAHALVLNGLTADVAELKARPASPADPAALKAALLDPEVLAAIATAVNDEDHRRSAS